MPALDVQQEEATAKNEEFPVEKEEDKFDMEQQHKKQVEAENNNSAGKEPIKGQTEFGRKIYTGQNGQRDLKVHYEMGKSGRKFIEINMVFLIKKRKIIKLIRALDRQLSISQIFLYRRIFLVLCEQWMSYWNRCMTRRALLSKVFLYIFY